MAFFFVLSQPPDGISDAEYTAWYDVHHAEVLQLPAFVGAQLRAAVDSGTMTFPEWYGGVVSSGYRGGEPTAFGA
jgi:hypothetical protein